MRKVIIVSSLLIMLAFCIGHWRGYNSGQYETTLAMAHLLSEADGKSERWQYAAEHYGGICKWLLDNKPIYGTITMDANTVLSDCLIVSGSSEASVDISGVNCLVANNYFMAIDMDWVVSTTATDPNEFDKKVMILPEHRRPY